MKDFRKFIKQLNKDSRFSIIQVPGRKNTIKIIYRATGEMYSVHPADYAIIPIKSWIKRKTNG